MFERYTEQARRVIFCARYEASQFGAPEIDTEHLVLGLVREARLVGNLWLPRAQPEIIRGRVESWLPRQTSISTSVNLRLTAASQHVLHCDMVEADRLNSKPTCIRSPAAGIDSC